MKHTSFVTQHFLVPTDEIVGKSQLENKTRNKTHAAYDEMNILATWKGTNCSSSVCEWDGCTIAATEWYVAMANSRTSAPIPRIETVLGSQLSN